ncbi:hypothetical protein NW765_016547 [Fusarium oxysporum]|nr:hypothetical protein NW765_016547 [Fusarium oxysporum]
MEVCQPEGYTGVWYPQRPQGQLGSAKEMPSLVRREAADSPNPLTCLPVLMDKGSLFSILIGALQYVNVMTLQTSLASLSIEIYNLNYLQAGFIYIPCGVCSAVSAKVTGKYIDWNFRRTRQRLGVEDARSVGDIEGFPLEHTRLEGAYLLTIICTLTTVGYGLIVEFKTVRS